MNPDLEFWTALVIYGGLILAGLLVSITLGAMALALRGKLKRKNIIKELYDEKERKNGQEKGGSKGRW